MLSHSEIMSAIDGLPHGTRHSISEIASLFDEKLARVRGHFNNYRSTILRPSNGGSSSPKRLYDPPTIRAYLLFRVMRSELSYNGPHVERILQTFAVDILWAKLAEGIPQLSSFILANMPNTNGA